MKRTTVLRAVASAAVPLSLVFPAGTPAVRAGFGPLVPTNPQAGLPVRGTTVDSLNWAGYADLAASGQHITSVETSFTVPNAGLLPPGFSATWAGIGGYNTSDLIQAGVAEDSVPSNPLLGDQYYAWYEILPASETQLTGCSGDANCAVTPGDKISESIVAGSGRTWTISLSDVGHWSWSKTLSYASSYSSAEWIQEAPSLSGLQTVIANDGTVRFGPDDTYAVGGGAARTIASGSPVQIVLSPGVINEATPSALAADGKSFNVCTYAQTCAAP